MPESGLAPIGLTRGIVRLEPYHAGWARLFTEEAARLTAALGASAVRIEHVGSTAVPGMVAKPILDIVVALRSMSDADEAARVLEGIDYEVFPEDPVADRLFLVKGTPEMRRFHLSLCELSSACWRSHVLLRDVLRAHPGFAEEYATLKRHLAARYAEDRAAYTAGKAEFIRHVLTAAEHRAGNDSASQP